MSRSSKKGSYFGANLRRNMCLFVGGGEVVGVAGKARGGYHVTF